MQRHIVYNVVPLFLCRSVARFCQGNSLLHRDEAIAAWRQSNCCMAMQQSTLLEKSSLLELDEAASHKKLLLSGKSTEPKVNDSQDATEHRRGWTPPAPDRREDPPGLCRSLYQSPRRAAEYVIRLISTCLWLCRPFFPFHHTITRGSHPVCSLSSLRDFS